MSTSKPTSPELQNLNVTRIADNGETGDNRLVLWRTADGVECVETSGNNVWPDDEGFADMRREAQGYQRVDVELESAVGPRVIYFASVDEDELDAALPTGWRVTGADAVKLTDGRWSAPLVQDDDNAQA